MTDTEILSIAKEFAATKIQNYISLFKQKFKKGDDPFHEELEEAVYQIHLASTIYQVRGVEGQAARRTFQHLNAYLKFPVFHIKKRDRRKPDRINSLLNFGYYLLFSCINVTVRAAGLNPYLGFLHNPGNNYESFVCDIQELFRSRIDRFLQRLINLQIIKEDDFVETRGGFYLNKEAKKKFLNQWEKELNLKASKKSLSLKEHIYTQVVVIKNWILENKILTLYNWHERTGDERIDQ